MIADRYTKVVLTIIAFTLVIIAAENGIQQARAFGDIQKVQICDVGNQCAYVSEKTETRIGGITTHSYSLNVHSE